MKKVLYIVSDIDKALAFEWVNDYLNKSAIDLSFVIIGQSNSHLTEYLKSKGTKVINLRYTNKLSLLWVFIRLLAYLVRQRPQIVHTHLFYANMLGLTAAKLLCIKKRIFTRHHAMVHYNEYPSGLKWDKYLNQLATHIIAVSENVKNILINRDGVNPNKVNVIHHGFDFKYFQERSEDNINLLREKYNISSMAVVVGVISRYLELKGIQYVIPAFEELKKSTPLAHLILANARGPFAPTIKSLLQQLPKESYTEIEFENDLASLYRLFNIYVHVPVDSECESFGQTYIEALTCGVPSVFTLSGVAPEFIKHKVNALVVPFKDSDSIYKALVKLLNNPLLAEQLVQTAKPSIQPFALNLMIDKLESLYHA